MNASVTDGPERSAIAAAVRTKRPAPMMAPIPSPTSDKGPRVRTRGALPLSALRRSMDLVRNNELATRVLSQLFNEFLSKSSLIIHALFQCCPQAFAGAALRRDQIIYTGIPSSTIIRPGQVYCGW